MDNNGQPKIFADDPTDEPISPVPPVESAASLTPDSTPEPSVPPASPAEPASVEPSAPDSVPPEPSAPETSAPETSTPVSEEPPAPEPPKLDSPEAIVAAAANETPIAVKSGAFGKGQPKKLSRAASLLIALVFIALGAAAAYYFLVYKK